MSEMERDERHQPRDRDGGGAADEEIRRRAYELYEARRGESGSGDEVADWLAAEREVHEGRLRNDVPHVPGATPDSAPRQDATSRGRLRRRP